MTYSINTSKYTAKKAVDINGTIFKVRKITTDEQFMIYDLQAKLKNIGPDSVEEARTLYGKGEDLIYSMFDDEKKAREVLKGLDLTSLADLYKDIMENAEDVED